MSRTSLLDSFFKQGRRLVFAATKKRHVGVDLHGNDYFLHFPSPSGPPRRIIQYKDSTPNPSSVPMLWHQWLRGHRDLPPTPADIEAEEARAAALREKVGKLKDADEKLRVQELAERRMSGRTEVGEDMSAEGYLRELETEMEQDSRWSRAQKKP